MALLSYCLLLLVSFVVEGEIPGLPLPEQSRPTLGDGLASDELACTQVIAFEAERVLVAVLPVNEGRCRLQVKCCIISGVFETAPLSLERLV